MLSRHVEPADRTNFLSARPAQRASGELHFPFHHSNFHYFIAHIALFIHSTKLVFHIGTGVSLALKTQVTNWATIPRRKINDLLDCIRIKRKNATAVTLQSSIDGCKSILVVMVSCLLLTHSHFSPLVWLAGSTLVADGDNRQVSAAPTAIHADTLRQMQSNE